MRSDPLESPAFEIPTGAVSATLRAVLDNTPISIALVSLNRTYLFGNRFFLDTYKLTASELIGRSTRMLFCSDEDYENFGRICHPVITQGQTYDGEHILRRSDGGTFIARIIGQRIDPTAPALGTIWVVDDLTDQKLAEQTLRRAKEAAEEGRSNQQSLLAAIVESSDDAIIGMSLDGFFTSWNRAAERIFGYKADEILGHPGTVIIPPERRDEEELVFASICQGQQIEQYETERIGKDYRRISVSITLSPIRNREGTIIGVSKIIRDITENKKIYAKIKENEETFTTAFSACPEALAIVTIDDGKYKYVNEAFLEITGFRINDVIGHSSFDLGVWVEEDDRVNYVNALFDKGYLRGYKLRFRVKNNDIRDFLVSSEIMYIQGRAYSINFILDVTDRIKNETAIAVLLAEKEAILENALVGIVFLRHRTIVANNRRFEEIFGYPSKALIGQSTAILYPSEAIYLTTGERIYPAIGQGKPLTQTTELVRADGSLFWCEVTGNAIDPARPQDGSIWIFNDITERMRSEHERQRLSRALRLLSDCNLTLFHADDELQFLSEVCQLVVESGGYQGGWVGFAENDAENSVRPIAQAGFEDNFLESLRISWNGTTIFGLGPLGTAIRTGSTQIVQNTQFDPRFEPWSAIARIYGYKSCIGLPLIGHRQTLGGLALYAAEADAFGAEEVALLEELASNLALGIETLRVRRQNEATQAELAIAAITFNSQECMIVTDSDGVILRVNQAFTEITGFEPEEAVGRSPGMLGSGRQDREFYRAMWDEIDRTGMWQGEIWNRRKNGEDYAAWLTITAVKNGAGTVMNYVGTHFDITERKKAEEKINDLAFFDQLTGLPNRTLLVDRVRQVMKASDRSGSHGAILLIDVDNFKTLNDTLGHDIGDSFLKQVALRLSGCVRAEDTVARWGGDEFLLLLVGLSPELQDAAAHVKTVAEKLRAALNSPYLLNEAPYHCTASIGVTLFLGEDTSFDDLLKQSDLAMYRAKAAGRNAIRFFDPEMEATVKARASMEADLRSAIQQGQLELHFQPQIMNEAELTGAEALLRWHHPHLGMILPGDFIPLAEETGLILPLGNWVLEKACAQLASWASRKGLDKLSIAVNVSARQCRQPDFVEKVLGVISRTGANPKNLKLELTESLLVENVQDIVAKMLALRSSGVGFSLDDFGTGYSSLSYLKRLPLDQLKIDKSFVRDVFADANDGSIVRTIIMLARNLGLDVIAEGVETLEQKSFLADLGCHSYQGYLICRPLPADAFERFVLQAS